MERNLVESNIKEAFSDISVWLYHRHKEERGVKNEVLTLSSWDENGNDYREVQSEEANLGREENTEEDECNMSCIVPEMLGTEQNVHKLSSSWGLRVLDHTQIFM